MDGPVILIGLVAVIGNFYAINYIQNTPYVSDNKVVKTIVGSLNAVVMTILSTTYRVC